MANVGYESYLPLNRHPHAIFVEAQFDILTLVAILSSRYSSVLQMMFKRISWSRQTDG